MNQGEFKKAVEILEKEMDSKKQINLVNSSRAYAVLYHLTWIVLDLLKRTNHADKLDEISESEKKLVFYALKCQEKNIERDLMYAELAVS